MGSVDSQAVVAIVGGNKDRFAQRVQSDRPLRFYSCGSEGGCGELRALLASIKSGGIGEVWMLYRWIGHSESQRIQQVCRACGIRVSLFPGLGSLPL